MKTLFCISLFLILFSNHLSGQNNDIETLKKLNRDFLNSIVNRDTSTLSKILADDFLLINPGGMPVTGSMLCSAYNCIARNGQVECN